MMRATGRRLGAVALWAGALLAGAAAWAQAPVPVPVPVPVAVIADVAAPAAVTFSEADHLSFAQATQALKAGNLDAAEATLRQLQSRLPYRPELVNNLGVIAQLRGDVGQATTLFMAASKIEPHYLSVFSNAQRLASGARVSDAPFLVVESLPGAAASPPVRATDLAATRSAPRQSAALNTLARLDGTRAQERREMDSRLRGNDEAQMDSRLRGNDEIATTTVVIPAKAGIHPLPLPEAIEQWRQAWQNQDINAYLAWYAPDFVPTPAASKSAWEAKRRAVFAAPKTGVSVTFAEVSVKPEPNGELVEFKQRYNANNHADQGSKTMRWRLVDGEWRIASERFVAASKP